MVDEALCGWTALVAAWVQWVARFRWFVLPALCVLAAVALVYAGGHLRMDTSTSDLFSRHLAWRQTESRLDRAFPQLNDNLAIVIRGATPALADQATIRLGRALRADPHRFPYVYLGQDEPFLRRNGLLFESTAKLHALSRRLTRVQPLLGQWAQQPNLAGLLQVLGRVMRHTGGSGPAPSTADTIAASAFAPMLRHMSGVFGAAAQGRIHYLPWQSLLWPSSMAASSSMRVLAVRPKLDYGALLPARRSLQTIHRLTRKLQLDPQHGVHIGLTGPVAFQHHERASLMHDLPLFGALSVVLVTGLLLMALRSLRMVVATVFTLLLGLMLSIGFAALAVGRLNLLSVAFVLLYVGLGMDFGIHFCLSYREALAAGETHAQALRWTARHIAISITSSAITTALAFYVFALTPFTALAELGVIAGTSMLISLLMTLTALPALLALLHIPAPSRPPTSPHPGTWRLWPQRHRTLVLAGASALAVVSLATLPWLHFQTNPIRTRDPHSEAVRTFWQLVRSSRRSPLSISVLKPDETAARRVKRRLGALAGVSSTMDLASWVPSQQKAKLSILSDIRLILGPTIPQDFKLRPQDPAHQRAALHRFLPILRKYAAGASGQTGSAARRLLAQVERFWKQSNAGTDQKDVAALETGLLAGLPDTMNRLNQSLHARRITPSNVPPIIAQRWVSPKGTYRVAVFPSANLMNDTALRRFVATVTRAAPEASGTPVVMVRAAALVVHAFLEALGYTFVLTLMVLWLTFRNLTDSLRALIPLVLAGLLTCAAMVAAGISFNFANIIALPLLLGAGVDYGIHMVNRARQANTQGDSVLATSTPVAVVYSALTTLAGFGNLAFTGHGGPASMGQLLALGLTLVLITDMIVLPAVLPGHDARGAHA